MDKYKAYEILWSFINKNTLPEIYLDYNIEIASNEALKVIFKVSRNIARERTFIKVQLQRPPIHREIKLPANVTKLSISKVTRCNQYSGIRRTADTFSYRHAT